MSSSTEELQSKKDTHNKLNDATISHTLKCLLEIQISKIQFSRKAFITFKVKIRRKTSSYFTQVSHQGNDEKSKNYFLNGIIFRLKL